MRFASYLPRGARVGVASVRPSPHRSESRVSVQWVRLLEAAARNPALRFRFWVAARREGNHLARSQFAPYLRDLRGHAVQRALLLDPVDHAKHCLQGVDAGLRPLDVR